MSEKQGPGLGKQAGSGFRASFDLLHDTVVFLNLTPALQYRLANVHNKPAVGL